jgi:serine/threonine protein kinase
VSDSSQADTRLARLLHARGRFPLPNLLRQLEKVRVAREQDPNLTLAMTLVSDGLISAGEAERLIAEVGKGGGGSGQRPSWRVGGRVGDYLLTDLIGQGGMGIVFRAKHTVTGREVALKGVRIAEGDEGGLTRFQREAAAQAAVDEHPNVVRIHAAGIVGNGGYLAMELASGGDLDHLLRTGPLEDRDAAYLIARLSRGLAHVHALGIIHRDLKPANVLFSSDGTPKLVDFGLARLNEGGSRITHTGELLGTPTYMAPEQAKALHDEVDARTDVYCMGTILYEVLTGRPPVLGASAIEVLVKVLEETPTPPSTIRPGIDPQLEAICLKAMAKAQAERFQDAASMATALEEWLEAREDKTATPPALGAGIGAGVGALIVGAALALGFVSGLFLGSQPRSPLPSPLANETRSPPSASASLSSTPTETPTPTPLEWISFDDVAVGSLVTTAHHQSSIDNGWKNLAVPVRRGKGPAKKHHSLMFAVGHGPGRPIPPEGYLQDGFGVGAWVHASFTQPWNYGDLLSGRTPREKAKVVERKGWAALVRFASGDHRWTCLTELTLLRDGEAPGPGYASLQEQQIVLAPHPKHFPSDGADVRVPAVIVFERPRKRGSEVRVVYLSGGVETCVSRKAPLLDFRPRLGDLLHYHWEQPGPKGSERKRGKATFQRRDGPWLTWCRVEGETELRPILLGQIYFTREDLQAKTR